MLKKRWVRRPNVPGCCVADDVVASALPDDWEPQPCGDILNAYLNERAEQHKAVLAELEVALVTVDDDVGARVRGLADDLEGRLRETGREMRQTLEQISKKVI
ncbi:hypothetical protein EVAR_43287_1 [Eumeta japonica]|uniref:Uncharacterized protein n=1 Tax=Eumeta variegata TaxID=151549 RepID=A0A4C1WY08_EUMVA|nr:hypothetical protein EVAR_43287_1 [Eumeta japonica]